MLFLSTLETESFFKKQLKISMFLEKNLYNFFQICTLFLCVLSHFTFIIHSHVFLPSILDMSEGAAHLCEVRALLNTMSSVDGFE